MTEDQKELFYDLLTKKAVYGLDESEQGQLEEFDSSITEAEFRSFEATAAAIGLAGLESLEPMPAHLMAKIAADSKSSLSEPAAAAVPDAPVYGAEDVFRTSRPSPWFSWLGWLLAGAACIALAVNIATTRFGGAPEVADVRPTPTATQQAPSPAEMREQMLASASGVVRAVWAPGNVKDLKQVSGDVVWSDEKQAGYMRFRGLPANDVSKETYQLWIFDKTQDKATPIDGGTFDVSSDGEVIVPINAKLKAEGAEMFAITIEKPGGVVVSKREKIAALAKVEVPST